MAFAEPAVLHWAGEAPQRAGSVFVVAAPDDPIVDCLHGGSAVVLVAARVAGVHVRLHGAAEAIAALPLENLEADDAVRTTRRLVAPIPTGSVRAVLVHEGHILTVTAPSAPGCLSL